MRSQADRRRCIRMSAEGSCLKKEIPEEIPDKTKKPEASTCLVSGLSGAYGIRTRDLLDAIEARSQLR